MIKIHFLIPLATIILGVCAPSAQAAMKKNPEAKEATRVIAATKHLRSQPAAVAVFARGLC